MESALTTKGQATIPKAVRDHLRLKPGDRVKFFLHPDGSAVILPKLPTSSLKGMLNTYQQATPNDAIEDAAAEGAVERFQRATRGRRA